MVLTQLTARNTQMHLEPIREIMAVQKKADEQCVLLVLKNNTKGLIHLPLQMSGPTASGRQVDAQRSA